MGLRLNTRVVECLKANPGVRFTARDIALWIVENYPDECAEKLAASKRLSSDADLMQQIVAEIGATDRRLKRNGTRFGPLQSAQENIFGPSLVMRLSRKLLNPFMKAGR